MLRVNNLIGFGAGGKRALALSIYNKIVVWYERDETSGTTMTDEHTNGLDGTYSGVTVNQTGLATNLDKAVTFPATTPAVTVSHDASLSLTDMAVMLWMKRNGTQPTFPKLIWKKGTSNTSGHANYLLQMNGSTSAIFRVSSTPSTYNDTSAVTINDATVYQLIGQKSGTSLELYRNNSLDGTGTFSGTVDTTTKDLVFGHGDFAGDKFVGDQDQAAVFDTALTPAEIAYLWNSGDGVSYATLKAEAGL